MRRKRQKKGEERKGDKRAVHGGGLARPLGVCVCVCVCVFVCVCLCQRSSQVMHAPFAAGLLTGHSSHLWAEARVRGGLNHTHTHTENSA